MASRSLLARIIRGNDESTRNRPWLPSRFPPPWVLLSSGTISASGLADTRLVATTASSLAV